MTAPEPVSFIPEASVPQADTLRVKFRAEEPGDRNYILGCWNEGWRDAPECRDLNGGKYRRKFQAAVVGGDGVLWHPQTKILVGCSPDDRAWMWAFCVFTLAVGSHAPVIHWINVRPTLRDPDGGKREIRRQGIATRMLGIDRGPDGKVIGPGVKGRLTYTCRPGRQSSFKTGETWEVWADLVEALHKVDVKADYMPIEDWLEQHRGGR